MATIIAGKFAQQTQIQEAIDALLRAGFSQDQISSFYVNPAGQHDYYPLGGDHDKSPGAEESETGSLSGLAAGGAVGAAIGAAAGPLGAVTAGFVGAHIGSLIGTLGKMKEDGSEANENATPVRHSGLLVAVSVPEPDGESRATEVLRSVGAVDIESAQGTIIDGNWEDFDPVAAPSYIDTPPVQRH